MSFWYFSYCLAHFHVSNSMPMRKELLQLLTLHMCVQVSSDLHVNIIANAGHFVFIDQPELFNRALIDACSM